MSENSTKEFLYQSFNGSLTDDLNSYISAIISIISNFLLIFATSNIKSYTKSVRFAMFSMAFMRIFFSISVALTCPAIIYSKSVTSLYIIKNGVSLPIPIGDFFLSLFIAFIVMSCNGPAVQYLHVTYLLSSLSRKEVGYTISVIPLIIVFLSLFLIFVGYIPPSYDIHLSSILLEKIKEHGETSFLIVTVRQRFDEENESETFQYLSQLCTLFILIVMFISILVVIICYFYIRTKISRKFSMSSHTRKCQEQLNMALMLQFILPFITIHIPFYIIVILPFFEITAKVLADQVLFLFSWCPAINPIIVGIMVKNIREQIIPEECCGRRKPKTSQQASRSKIQIISL